MLLQAQRIALPSPWQELPPLPQAIAGQCAGTAGEDLLVAGGSSWSAPPWDGGRKGWSDAVWALAPGARAWRLVGHLPYPTGYAASVKVGDTLVCVGGQDGARVLNMVVQLGIRDGHLTLRDLPRLPIPLTNAGAAMMGGRLYVVGGQTSVEPAATSLKIWSLAMAGSGKRIAWREEEAPSWRYGRILPVVAGCGDDLFVASGAALVDDAKGRSHRIYLTDAWRLRQGSTWERLSDMPAAVVAAPAVCASDDSVIIFGGDDGRLANEIPALRDRHPGFSRTIRIVDLRTGAWSRGPELPLSLVTTAAVVWDGRFVIPGGEPKPGHRSSRVIAIVTTDAGFASRPSPR